MKQKFTELNYQGTHSNLTLIVIAILGLSEMIFLNCSFSNKKTYLYKPKCKENSFNSLQFHRYDSKIKILLLFMLQNCNIHVLINEACVLVVIMLRRSVDLQ
jgi:hypothetical protein